MFKENNDLIWAKVRCGAKIPTKNKEDAGYDFYPCFDEDYIIIDKLETKLIPTGIACAMPEEYYMQIHERGSTGSKGIKVSAGVIDSGFRGEIFIAITNTSPKTLVINKKDAGFLKMDDNSQFWFVYPYQKAIAQGVIHKLPRMNEVVVMYEDLLKIPSSRGVGMLGNSSELLTTLKGRSFR